MEKDYKNKTMEWIFCLPPTVALQEDPPRQTDRHTPAPDSGTEGVIEVPEQESNRNRDQAASDEFPHGAEDLCVAPIAAGRIRMRGGPRPS